LEICTDKDEIIIFISAFLQIGTKFFVKSTFVMPIAEGRMKEVSLKEDTIMV